VNVEEEEKLSDPLTHTFSAHDQSQDFTKEEISM
jgi:hypothetical protein